MVKRRTKKSAEAPVANDEEESIEKSDNEDKVDSTDEVKETAAPEPVEETSEVKASKPKAKKQKDSAEASEEEYEVAEINDMKIKSGRTVSFLVRWKGFGADDDTWESIDNLSCSSLIEEFLQISKRKPEYEKALENHLKYKERKKKQAEQVHDRSHLYRRGRCDYEEDSEEEQYVPKSRKILKKSK